MPGGSNLWLMVQVSGSTKAFPQKPLRISFGQVWREGIGVGADAEPADKEFKVSVVSVDDANHKTMSEYLKKCQETKDWTGLEESSLTWTPVHTVSVVRGDKDMAKPCPLR